MCIFFASHNMKLNIVESYYFCNLHYIEIVYENLVGMLEWVVINDGIASRKNIYYGFMMWIVITINNNGNSKNATYGLRHTAVAVSTVAVDKV